MSDPSVPVEIAEELIAAGKGSGPEIVVEDLSYEYPDGRRALKSINLSVDPGCFIGVMGPNGAGKSTLCLSLNGVIPHSLGGRFFGSVRICGRDTMEHPVYELAKSVGFVVQNPEAQILCSVVEEELAFGPENLCVEREEIGRRITALSRELRIEEVLERSPSQLSGGQVQRVITASVMIMKPRVVVFDEASSALDPKGANQFFELAGRLNREQGMTVLMTEHKSEQIAEFADLVAVLKDGQIVLSGSPQSVFSQVEKLIDLKVAPPQVTRLFHKLGFPASALPLTLDEAEQLVRRCLARDISKPGDTHSVSPQTSVGIKPESDPEPEPAPIIRVDDLSFSYDGSVEALSRVSFDVKPGEFMGIIGENGAGKSTLVKLLVGLLTPSSGKVTAFGKSGSELTPEALAGRIGLVLQNPDHQLFKSTVSEEVGVGPSQFGLSAEEREERVSEALARCGIEFLAERHPLSLSWGDRQRVALASILSMQPRLIIFDEPTTGQDLEGRTIFMELAKDLNRQGYTILVITHDMELIAKYTRRCLVLGKGRVLADGATRQIFGYPELLAETYIEVPQVIRLAHRLADFGIPQDLLTLDEVFEALKELGVQA